MQRDPDLVTVARVARTFRADPLPWLQGMTPAELEVLVAAHNSVVTEEKEAADRAREEVREQLRKGRNGGRW